MKKYAMIKLWIGLLLIIVDINLGNFDILPDFIGYFLVMTALEKVDYESEYFAKAVPFSLGMMVFSTIMYILEATTIISILNTLLPFVIQTLIYIPKIALLVLMYLIARGFSDMESRIGVNMSGSLLVWLSIIQGTLWIIMQILEHFSGQTIIMTGDALTLSTAMDILTPYVIIFIIGLIVTALYLAYLFGGQRRYLKWIGKE